jgi:hypothetical protein
MRGGSSPPSCDAAHFGIEREAEAQAVRTGLRQARDDAADDEVAPSSAGREGIGETQRADPDRR